MSGTPSSRSWYTVAVLTAAYVLAFIDRQILNLLAIPVQEDLGLSDTRMSLLMGFSFAVFYTVLGLPLGRLADSRSRRGLIAAGIFLWSFMTAGCALARGFWSFLLFRVGVGIGEASLSPAAYSLIADEFPREQRATATSVYSMGIWVGSGLALLLGGLVIQLASARGALELPLWGEVRPWRAVFVILGASGCLFTLLLATVREPPRLERRAPAAAGAGGLLPHVREHWRAFLCHHGGFALLALAGYAVASWLPTFFARAHGWSPARFGLVYGSLATVLGPLGMVLGGRLADRMAARGIADGTLRLSLIAALANVPALALCLLATGDDLAPLLLAPTVFLTSLPFGVAAAAVQEIAPGELRGRATALYLFTINLVGMGLGPTAVAVLTQEVLGDPRAVGLSILIVAAAAQLGAAFLLWSGLGPFRRSSRRLRGA